jgi:hypothetical protein
VGIRGWGLSFFLENDSTQEIAFGAYASEDEDDSTIDGKIFPML